MSNKKIYVELTLGHKAQIRPKPTAEGYTHDWEVFVRSEQGIIEAFVDRVIFHLHESFPKARRVLKEPPFSVKESGYAGFLFTIEIVFKNKEDPRRAEFKYDLFLQSEGHPISHSRREKLIFNFPSDDFAKKLIKGGGVVRKEKDSSRGDSFSANSASLITSHAGGKSSKHSSTNLGKGSPKSSFENLFGPPIIKRGVSSLTTATVAASPNPSGPSKDSRAGSSSGKGGKGESSYGQVNGGKGEKIPSKSPSEKHGGERSVNSPMPNLDSPSGSEGSNNNPSSSKSSKSGHNSSSSSTSEKRSRSEEKTRRMLPPEHAAVPRKSKKSEIFTPSPSSTSTSVPPEKSRKKSEKSKKRSSKHSSSSSRVKREVEDDSYPSTPEMPRREIKKEPLDIEIKKERIEKSQVSPISSSSDASSASSVSSGSEVNSEEEEESEVESEQEEMIEKSNKRIAAANSTSSSKRRSKQRSESESVSDESPPSPPLQRSPLSSPPSSSSSSGVPSPLPPKRRKTSNSSSEHTPDYNPGSASPMEKPNSSSSVKVKKESRHHRKRGEDEKRNRKSRKKSKKHKKKVFEEDPHSSDSSISSVASYASPMPGNGVSSNGLSPMPAFSSGATTTTTHEMGFLQELYARISTIEDPEKLQEVVDIVMDSGGRDLWTVESGFSFDFDLCRLSPLTIRKIQEAIID